MNRNQAIELGVILRGQRKELGLSAERLGGMTGTNQATISRLEHGRITSPRPAKLARIARALGLSLADVYARAGYLVPDELPSFEPYMSAKYRNLPKSAVAELARHFEELSARHSTDSRPVPHERRAKP